MSEALSIVCIRIQVVSIGDLLESGANCIFHYQQGEQHFYYYYASIGETTMLIIQHLAKTKYKRYVGFKNQKVIESDLLNTDCPVPIIEVENDDIFNLTLEAPAEEEKAQFEPDKDAQIPLIREPTNTK